MHALALALLLAAVPSESWGVESESLVAPPVLDLGVHVKASVSQGEVHRYSFLLGTDELAEVVVEQLGVDVTLVLFGPSCEKLIEIDSLNGQWDAEELAWIAQVPGSYTLEVQASSASPGALYEVALQTPHPATAADRRLFAAQSLYAKGYALFHDERPEAQRRAVATFEQALAIFRELGDPYREGLTLVAMATEDRDYLGESARAVESFQAALTIWRKLGKRHLEASTLIALAIAHYRLQQMPLAIAILEEAHAMEREVGDAAGEAEAVSDLGMVYDWLGEKERAIELYLRALPILQRTGNVDVEQYTWNNLALVYENRGEMQKALNAYQEALDLSRRAARRSAEEVILANLGRTYRALGDEERGELHLRQAAAIARELGDPLAEAVALRNIARSQAQRGEAAAAIAMDEAALERAREAKDTRFQTIVLNALSETVGSQGDARRALELAETALFLAKSNGDRFNEGVADANLGIARGALGQLEEAREALVAALGIRRGIGDRMGVAQSELAVARLERDHGRLDVALDWVHQALDILELLRTEVLGHDLRASFFGTLQRHYGFALDLLMRMHATDPGGGFDATALETAERARARSLLDLVSETKAGVRLGVDPTLLERERTLRNVIGSRLDAQVRLLSSRHTEQEAADAAAALDSMRLERQRLEEQILRSNPRYAELSQPRPATVAEIQGALGGDTLLLEYAFGEGRTFLWVVGARGRSTHILAPATEVQAAARRFYDLVSERNRRVRFEPPAERAKRIARADAECSGAALALGRMLLGPVRHELGGKRLVIVAEGALQYVPFAALATRKGRPLLADHEIVVLPSASVLSFLRGEKIVPNSRPAVAVFADPVFDDADPRVRNAAGRDRPRESTARQPDTAGEGVSFERLPFTRREAEAILRLAPGGTSALGFKATRDAVLSASVEGAEILHLATHAVLDTRRPELSGVVLSLVDPDGRPRQGFLSVADVFGMNLHSDLVVLSGCRTALGKDLRGEGLLSLTRAFLSAGARRVVSSFWKVSDEKTATLMSRFYNAMLGPEHLPPAAALRRAQLAMRRAPKTAPPYYWAGFAVQGGW